MISFSEVVDKDCIYQVKETHFDPKSVHLVRTPEDLSQAIDSTVYKYRYYEQNPYVNSGTNFLLSELIASRAISNLLIRNMDPKNTLFYTTCPSEFIPISNNPADLDFLHDEVFPQTPLPIFYYMLEHEALHYQKAIELGFAALFGLRITTSPDLYANLAVSYCPFSTSQMSLKELACGVAQINLATFGLRSEYFEPTHLDGDQRGYQFWKEVASHGVKALSPGFNGMVVDVSFDLLNQLLPRK